MRPSGKKHTSTRRLLTALVVCGMSTVVLPGAASAKILWSGDYESGDFRQWHKTSGNEPNFSQMPDYCRPTGYAEGGDGTCLSLSTSIKRQGKYAAKFTVKNAANGSEPADCDTAGTKCDRRRAELTGQIIHPDRYNALPYMSERWISVSHYVPADWAPVSSSGWGSITVFQIKPRNENGLSPTFAINLTGNAWRIEHRWDDAANPSTSQVPWQQQMFYDNVYPAANGSDSGADLRSDFPNQSVSQKALGSINKGGWTDWVIHVKFDARGKAAGGTGFLEVWKRENQGDWIKVLNIRPKKISRGGMTFDHGIGYNSPATSGNNGGFGIKAGLYMHKADAWNLSSPRTIYNDNIRIGDASTKFEEISPDGSAPGQSAQIAPPSPPVLFDIR